MPTVEIVGTGPAADAVTAALEDVEATVTAAETPQLAGSDLAVVIAESGSETFETASDRAIDSETPWVAVELGGVGGVPVTAVSVAAFAPETACYDCLRKRVDANADEQQFSEADPSPDTVRFAGAVAGRRIVRALTGEAAPFGTVVELPHTERPLLPVPGCHCGGRPSREIRRDETDQEGPDALTRAEGGLDERLGIVQNVGEAESFPAPYYLATVFDTAGFSDVSAPRQAAGVADDWDTAFMKALGESFERYAGGVYRAGDLPTGRPEQLEGAIDPAAFVHPDGGDWSSDGEFSWVPATALVTDEQRLVPAETVFYPPPSRRLRPATTTGLGLGSGGVDALLSGLYEVVERDAAMLSWYSTYDPLEVVVADHDLYDRLRRRARAEDLDVTAVLLTQDVDVPVVAVAVQRSEWPKFALGSSADLDPAAAATGALEEALQNWLELRGMGEAQARESEGAIGRYAAQPGQVEGFVDAETAIPLDSIGPSSVPDGHGELAELIERVTDASLTPYASRLTTRDLEQLGFEAVRVLCPSAQPLFFGDSYFGDRASRVPEELGFDARLGRRHHPFP